MAKQDDRASSAPSTHILTRYKARLIPHTRFTETFDDLIKALDAMRPSRIITVQGPTGVGKTTLLNAVYHDGIKRALSDPHWSSRRIPMVRLVAPLEGKRRQFSWPKYYEEMLKAADERGIKSKVDPERLLLPGGFHSRRWEKRPTCRAR